MLSRKRFTYFQPEYYYDDGTNIGWELPDGLFSFQAFLSEDDCIAWLENNGHNPNDFAINEYHDDDIEDVTLLYPDGSAIMRIEEVPEDGIVNMLADEVLFNAGSMDNLVTLKQDDETQQEYEDRVYQMAVDAVYKAIVAIEESGEYNFQAYCGTPDVEWYDKARDWAVKDVMAWMTE